MKTLNIIRSKNNQDKKGITLMTLIITIILIVVLAGAVILTLSFSDPVGEANEARFKADIQSMKDSYRVLYDDLLYKNLGKEEKIKDTDFKDVVPDEYKDEFKAGKDGLEYIGDDEEKKEIAEEMGLGKKGITTIEDIVVIADITSIEIETIIKNGESVDEYIYYIKEVGSEEWTEYRSQENKYTIDGVKEDTEYEVMVEILKTEADGEQKREESEIKVVRTKKLEAGKLIMKLNDENGDSYIEGTWTKENVYLEVQGEKTTYSVTGANEVESTSEPVVLRNEGESKVILKTKDGANEITKEYKVKIDKQEPEGKMQKEIRLKTEESANVIVSAVEVTDNLSGVKEYEYYIDGKQVAVSKENKYTYENVKKGKYELKIVIVDNAKNKKELIRTVEVGMPDINDESKVDIQKTPVEWTNGNVKLKITFTAEDEYTPQYSEDKVRWTDVERVYEKQIEENKKVYIRFVYHGEEDIIGNQREIEIANIDKEVPVINSIESEVGNIASEDVKIIAKAIDTLSGLIGYQFSREESLTATSSGWETIPNTKEEIVKEYLASENGKYYFYVKDEAGNIAKEEIEIGSIDKEPPVLESLNVTSPDEGIYKAGETVTIVATYSENVYGEIPELKIAFGEGEERVAQAVGEIVENKITYTYEIKEGDNGKLECKSYTGTLRDNAQNELILTKKTLGGNEITADTTPPTDDMPILVSNTNSITATFQQTDNIGINRATIEYAIKAEEDGAWGTWISENADTHTFSNLVMNTSYEIKTRVKDIAGNERESQVAKISTVNITKPTISAPSAWTKEDVTVTITYPNIEGTTKQYSTNGTSWTDTDSSVQTVTVSTNNTTVYARLIDNTNQTSENATHTVTNIDKLPPNIFTPTASGAGDIDVNMIKVTATTSDVANETNGASGIKNYKFSKDNGATWTPEQTSNVYTFTGLTSNTTYNIKVMVTDNALNEIISNVAAIKTLEAVAKIGTTEYSSIQKAFNAAPDNTATTVLLLKTTTESPTLAAAKNVTFNMDSKTVTGTITSNGAIAMQTGTVTGAISLQGNKTDSLTNINTQRLSIGSSSTVGQTKVTVSGGSYTGTGNIIVTWGNLTMGGNVTVKNTTGNAAIYNEPGATLTVNAGTYESPYATVKNLGNAIIQGGTHTCSNTSTTNAALCNVREANLGNTPTMTIKGGTFTGNKQGALVNVQGTVNIQGGTFTSNIDTVNNNGGTMNISTGKIKSTGSGTHTGIYNYGSGAITMTGGTIEGVTYGIYNEKGSFALSAGTITSNSAPAIMNEGSNFTISGTVQITGKTTTAIQNLEAGVMEIKGGTITCPSTNSYAVANKNTAILKMSAGTINASSGSAMINQSTVNTSQNIAFAMSGGTLAGGVSNAGAARISGGKITGLIQNRGTYCEISGGTIDGAVVNNTAATNMLMISGTANISSKTYAQVVTNDAGIMSIAGGTITYSGTNTDAGAAIWNCAVLTMSGGNARSTVFGLVNQGANASTTLMGSSSIAVSGSSFAVLIDSGIVNHRAGTIASNGTSSCAVVVPLNATFNVNGGTTTSKRTGVIVNGGTVTMTSGRITPASGYYAIRKNSGSVRVTGGTAVPRYNC